MRIPLPSLPFTSPAPARIYEPDPNLGKARSKALKELEALRKEFGLKRDDWVIDTARTGILHATAPSSLNSSTLGLERRIGWARKELQRRRDGGLRSDLRHFSGTEHRPVAAKRP